MSGLKPESTSLPVTNIFRYITDLDPLSIHALLTTASTSQAQVLKDLIYRHLMGEISLGVDIPVS